MSKYTKKYKIKNKYIIVTIILLFVVSLVGCQTGDGNSKDTNSDEGETSEDMTPTPIPEATIAPTSTPTPEPTTSSTEAPTHSQSAIQEPTHQSVQVLIYKGDRKLQLWQDSSLIAEYDIGLGFTPIGHKQVEGDGKTPEGSYYVCTRNDKSKFYLSLGLSYPSIPDATRGLEEGLITQNEHDQIVSAINSKAMPPWNTKLGGAIMIHGHGGDSDWTEGCAAVDNKEMDLLWEYCEIGTPVTIYP